jgi:hypothetical protein
LITADRFVTRDVAEFDALERAMTSGGLRTAQFFLTHPRILLAVASVLHQHADLATNRYFSAVPYLFGSTAAKYSLTPRDTAPRAAAPARHPNFLREALRARLAEGSIVFDFSVQLQKSPRATPIEDASVAWNEHDAPFHKVATLEIPAQVFDTPERQHFAENLSFNPWRCLPEHRPLGGINRARRQVYRAVSAYRHDRNAEPVGEPELPK